MPKIIFFGTQHFGAGMLDALIDSKQYEIAAIVTQPDRPVGRAHEIEMSPVKKLALARGIKTILQPETLKNFTETTKLPEADAFVVCQYGLIIPQAVLDLPKKGTINVHTSLLPKYRGASPIQTALINGETETGVTIMLMDAKMDHGPILAQENILITADDTAVTLAEKMIPIAKKLLIQTLAGWLNGMVSPQEQNHTKATLCTTLSRADGKLNFSKTASELYNMYRGTYLWPGVWTTWKGKRLKLLNIRPSDRPGKPRQAIIDQKKILVGAAYGSLEVRELQLEGKKAMSTEQFIAGYPDFNNATLE
ncbi:MAG: methionyl-tRNA formyltransferase [Candidatus Magasanikbacteria bacterium RIFCSPLOWO2_02_FULL_44_11]|uniref:Methionyl-tRNA formyltransferase n=1 Tax=Candidatus Magasanikbacteria bacterium RIFCSPLOWO2_02_FULL_44_11 TaxID=1798689 RepID=A0A1F6NBF9_9BACT|nr:MAG: methionyl-tRNA formyltransferase [Candidatus Magasanikbacteria bacterium RIFCSPLOWO2_02_FULL_44_11]